MATLRAYSYAPIALFAAHIIDVDLDLEVLRCCLRPVLACSKGLLQAQAV
jgi:hypothetical protein